MFWIRNLNYVVGKIKKIDEMVLTFFIPLVVYVAMLLYHLKFVLSSA